MWAYAGHPVVRLENELLRADVVPRLGGKILHLVDKLGDREVLWRNPRVVPRAGPLQANVDDYFAGGWDDAFPTGDGCENEYGDALPYMGEVWNLALRPELDYSASDEVSVVLAGQTPITPARWTRTLSLRAGEPLMRLETRIENVGYLPFSFLWGSHPALAVHEGMRLDVPAARGEVTDAGHSGALGHLGETYPYPHLREQADEAVDVRRVSAPSAGDHALHALTGLREGWVAATDPGSRRGFGLVFDPQVHRAVWQWMSYGGFRGWYHAILEPWIAPQTSLSAALRAGTARTLEPGESFASSMTAVIFSGVSSVDHLDSSGAVRARPD